MASFTSKGGSTGSYACAVLVKTVRETNWRRSIGDAAGGSFWVVVALSGMVGSGWLMTELPWTAFLRLIAVWSAVAVLFVVYSRHQVRQYDCAC